jgi:mannose/fructose/N-acetylgalactosamine-specific phosphotransferase system component IID
MDSKINIWKVVTAFMIGGIIVSCASLLGTQVSTKVASIFYSLPFTMIPVAFFIWNSSKQEHGTRQVSNFMGQTIPAMFGLFVFIIPFWLSLKKLSFWVSLIIALGSWFMWVIFLWFAICPSPLPCIPFFYKDLKTYLITKK